MRERPMRRTDRLRRSSGKLRYENAASPSTGDRLRRTEPKEFGWIARLTFVLAGTLIGLYGYAEMKVGNLIWTNWQAQNVTAGFVVFVGFILVLIGIIPWRRAQVGSTNDPQKRRYRIHPRYWR